jgi:putative lipoic acid-binding regulatory protein
MTESKGFEFPGRFELAAMGTAGADLAQRVPAVIEGLGLAVDRQSLRTRASSAGNYESVSVAFVAETREQLDAAHAALRALPEIKWTL